MNRDAVIQGSYRYSLTREWEPLISAKCVFIMLNPSTADAEIDDPTIRRCIGFSKRLGCSSLEVVNLFAIRSTDPKEIWREREGSFDPIGPGNNQFIIDAARRGLYVIAAWGTQNNRIVKERSKSVKSMLNNFDIETHCLGKTKSGDPKHPLYLPLDAELQWFK